MTDRQRMILAELQWLCDDAPTWAAQGTGWLPFHVRWFRQGRLSDKVGGVRPNDEELKQTTEAVIKRDLDTLARGGLVGKVTPRGFGNRTVFWITDKGREALQ